MPPRQVFDPGELPLWAHQRQAIETCDRYFNANVTRAALVQLPTGTGKTGIMAAVATKRALSRPVLVVCPSAALVEQLQYELRSGFWDRIGAPQRWVPEAVLQLLPSDIDALENAITGLTAGHRLVTVGTVQALQQIHAGPNYQRLAGKFGTVLFDEGHREPAPSWAEAVRELGVPTVLFSATPFRNDLKVFDVDLDFVEFLSFQHAVRDGLIRGIEIRETALAGTALEFARQVVEERDRLIAEGRFEPHHKMIVRADHVDNVRALFDALNRVLGNRDDGVLALHNTFHLEGPPGRQLRPDVPRDLRDRTERFLIHQFMLTEGIDDPACTMLALYEPFSMERQLVQQAGRLTRHPGPIGDAAAPALVLARAGDDVQKMWDRFLAFDDACVRNGGRPPLRNDARILENLVEALPEVDYVSGKFRTRLEFTGDLADDLRVPRSAIVFDLDADFDMENFDREISRALLDEDRFEAARGSIEEGRCRFHITLRLRQSPFLEESLFQSASLELTAYAQHGQRLFFYDSAGLWIDEIGSVADRVAARPLRSLLPQKDDSVVTSVFLKNTDLGPLAVRSRSISARSLERSGVFMGEHLNVVTRATGRVDTWRRAVGFARSRITQGEGAQATLQEFFEWAGAVGGELDAAPAGASLFNRFAAPTAVPRNPNPLNILVDLEAFIGEFLNEDEQIADFDLENVCLDLEADLNGPEGFQSRFDLTVDGGAATVWLKWDNKKRKYWVRSEVLSSLKLKDNPRISLTRRLNQQQPFRIIPEELSSIYSYGRFYSSNLNLVGPQGPGRLVLDLIEGLPGLEAIRSEKGNLRTRADTWPAGSLFGFIDNALRPGSANPRFGPTFPAMVCDDIGQEAADFIAADDGTASGLPRAALIAAKWKPGAPGVSSSHLYDVCGQVVKNLAYLKVDARDLPGTSGRWNQPWRLNGGSVPRRRAGPGAQGFRGLFANIRSRPATQRQMWMVLGGGVLSRGALEAAFARQPPQPHVLQFFHLVLSTYASCQSVGAELKIFCAP